MKGVRGVRGVREDKEGLYHSARDLIYVRLRGEPQGKGGEGAEDEEEGVSLPLSFAFPRGKEGVAQLRSHQVDRQVSYISSH